MELARNLVLEIATASQRVVSAAIEYASRKKFRNVRSCHFRLEKELQSISVAAGGILGVLCNSSLPSGPPLDDRLQEWLSSDELPTCLDTLHEMESMLQDDTWMSMVFKFVNTALRSSVPEGKIDAAVQLFDSRRNYFHFLLTTDVWNREELQQRLRVPPDQPTLEPLLQPSIGNGSALGRESAIFRYGRTSRPTAMGEEDMRRVDSLKKLDEILEWLDGLSCAVKQEETLSLRQPDTCTWLESTSEYDSWRNNDDASLWLQGKPGSGKTVLASFVAGTLKRESSSGHFLVFFYCDFRNERSTNAAEVMRSLLSQLLRHLRDEKIDPGMVADDLVREKNGDTPIFNNVKQLAALVSQTARQFDRQPSVVVDALDECKDHEKLIDGLRILSKGGLRLFLTSRPVQSIKNGLRNVPSISMDKMTSAVSTDIALHVRRELESRRRLRDLEPGLKMEIHSILCDKADGMFRWVQCQIDTLNQCATKVDVREALDHLPIGLDETYKRILLAIDTELPEGKLALRALVWLVGSLRPLRLLEILEGLTIHVEGRIMDRDSAPLHKGALLDACGSLVTYREDTDIIIVSHFSVKEYLIGDLTRMELPKYHIIYPDTHEHLARACICYVILYLKHIHETSEQTLHRIIRTGQTHSSENPTIFSTSQELLDYVFACGFHHLAYLGPANHAVLKDLADLRSEMEGDRAAWEAIRQRSQRLSVPWPAWEHDFMLYILIAFASDSLLAVFLGNHPRLFESRYQTNPLVYAAHFCKPQHGEILLSHGAKVNEKGLVVDTSHRALPLVVAVSRQHEAMVDLLLSAGSTVPPQLFTRCTYHHFPIRIARRLLLTDEFAEWAAEPRNNLSSPVGLLERRLPLAYERDILVTIRRLVQVGSDPTVHNSARKTAFHLAIEGGYQAIVVYLLLTGVPLPFDFTSTTSRIAPWQKTWIVRFIVDAAVDVRVHSTEDTVLHLAVMFLGQDECLKAVKILLGAGHRALVYNKALMIPFQLALDRGYIPVADYLLSQQKPASPDVLAAVIDSGCSMALRLETLRSLISGVAAIDGLTTRGDGLLHRAALRFGDRQGLEVTKLLVAAGCNPSTPDKDGRTPLHVALHGELPLLADYLLSTGGPFPSDTLMAILCCKLPTEWRAQKACALIDQGADISGLSAGRNTLLHTTALYLDDSHGSAVAKLLVDAGCDPLARNEAGKTSLHIVLDRGHLSMAECLLSVAREKPPPCDVLFALLRSRCPMDWIADKFCSLASEGIDVHSLAPDGNSFIHVAVTFLDEDACLTCVVFLVNHGYNPSMQCAKGKTVLCLAHEMGYVSIMEYILSLDQMEKPDQPLLDDILFSILRQSHVGKVSLLRMLIEKGANTRATKNGDTPLHVALLPNQKPLRMRKSPASRLVDAQLDVLRILIDGGGDVSATNSCGWMPLHLAVADVNVPVVKYLLSIDTSAQLPEDILFYTINSVRLAPIKDICAVLQLLVRRGANVHALAAGGDTLLHTVVKIPRSNFLGFRRAQLGIINFLIDSGCNPSQGDAGGRPPIHFAIERGLTDIVEYLLPRTSPLPLALSEAADRILRPSSPEWDGSEIELVLGHIFASPEPPHRDEGSDVWEPWV